MKEVLYFIGSLIFCFLMAWMMLDACEREREIEAERMLDLCEKYPEMECGG